MLQPKAAVKAEAVARGQTQVIGVRDFPADDSVMIWWWRWWCWSGLGVTIGCVGHELEMMVGVRDLWSGCGDEC